MQENWQVSLKQNIKDKYVKNSKETKEWVDVNISTSGLLNLTLVSNSFFGVSIP
ncbi:hypothetical protein [Hydrocoleum sp. CS-953]|uniref:hypothetical protein n=1 Tax=Microcoleaceae TaxID=1892252 RepID=UPI001FEF998C|nr:hypothetical protein [Hydrocoleum sp. CS-953]